jgi:tetratricopeptide (TPR) repeat protein
MILNKQGKVRNNEELERFKKIIDNTLLKNEKKALSTETRYLYYHIYSAYYFGIGDYDQSYTYLTRNVELIEQSPDIFREEPNIYFSVLTNQIYVGSQLKRYNEVFDSLRKLRSSLATFENGKNDDLEVKLFSSAMSIELTIYLQTGEFEKAVELAPIIEEKLTRFDGKFTKLRRAYFYFIVSAAYFGAGKYSLALRWINKLLNSPEFEESEDIYCFAQIMSLIIHIELKHDDFVPRAFKSTYRYLSSRNRVYKFENVFMDFIGKILKTTRRDEQTKFYRELKAALVDLKNDSFERSAFEYFDFISWAESKVRRVPFRDVVEEEVKIQG